MLNVHLSYKPPSYWGILFRSGGIISKFGCMKKFRDLVVLSGGCHKGVILQRRYLKRRFYFGRPFMPDNKRGCNGSVCPCTRID